MNKLKPEDVMKALECCVKVGGYRDAHYCKDCPLREERCALLLPQNALALLREKDALIEALAKNNADLEAELAETHDLCEEKDAEIERYKKTVGDLVIRDGEVVGIIDGKETRYIDKSVSNVLKTMAVNRAKANTVGNMQKRLKEKAFSVPTAYNSHFGRMVDQIAKEVLEDKNEP